MHSTPSDVSIGLLQESDLETADGAVVECFAAWGTRLGGLFTFAHSQKHVGLYQKFGFWPRFLTALMSMPVEERKLDPGSSCYSAVAETDRAAVLRECRDVTSAIYDGLDLHREMESVRTQRLGDTVLVRDGSTLAGLAVCHYGAATEAGSGRCSIKFAGVRPGPEAGRNFGQLLHGCEALSPAASAPIARASRCTETTIRGTTARACSLSTTGGNGFGTWDSGFDTPHQYPYKGITRALSSYTPSTEGGWNEAVQGPCTRSADRPGQCLRLGTGDRPVVGHRER